MPATQLEHDEAEADEYLPAAHAPGIAEPPVQNLPAEHGEGLVIALEAQYVPALQLEHAEAPSLP